MKPFLNAFRLMYLAQPPNMYKEKYMPNGLKPIEAFFSDISNNLIVWAAKDDSIYYETKDYWYRYQVECPNKAHDLYDHTDYDGIVWMRRFDKDSSNEITDFANKHSVVGLGKKWLMNFGASSRVPVE